MRKYFYKELRTFGEKIKVGTDYTLIHKDWRGNFNFSLLYYANFRHNVVKKNGVVNYSNLIILNLLTGFNFYKLFSKDKLPDKFKNLVLTDEMKKEIKLNNVTIDVYSYLGNGKNWLEKVYEKDVLTFESNHFYLVVNNHLIKRFSKPIPIIQFPKVFRLHYIDKQKIKCRFTELNKSVISRSKKANLAHYAYMRELKELEKDPAKNYLNFFKEKPVFDDTRDYIGYIDLLGSTLFTELLAMELF